MSRCPTAERRAYAETVAERFANPFLRHELISIALNSVSKWRVRILPTVKDAVAAGRGAPPNLAFSLAALFRFYRGRPEGGAYLGARERGDYPLRDDPAALAAFASIWAEAGSDGGGQRRLASVARDAALGRRPVDDRRSRTRDAGGGGGDRKARRSRRARGAALANADRQDGSRILTSARAGLVPHGSRREETTMPFQPVDSRRLYEQVADQIGGLVRRGEFKPASACRRSAIWRRCSLSAGRSCARR